MVMKSSLKEHMDVGTGIHEEFPFVQGNGDDFF